jgi:hypothetical protein
MPTRYKDERPVDQDSQAGEVVVRGEVSEHRRKIIKASVIAVPTIVTLCNGAAAAATSALGCIDKDAMAPPADKIVVEQDTWVRKVATIKSGLKISIDGGPPDGPPGTYLIVDGKYYKQDATDGSYELILGTVAERDKPNPTTSTVYVLCYIEFDESGNIVGRTYYPDQAGDGEFQVTASCLCSVNPNYSSSG